MHPAFLIAVLLVTVPACAQWQIVTPSPTVSDLYAIDNAGRGAAWAAGSNGTVIRTMDGGAHWQICAVPADAGHLDFRGIQAFDASTAFVISTGKGSLSRLYKTTDGCQTWTLLFINPTYDSWDGIALGPLRVNRRGLPEEPSGPLYILGGPVGKHFMLWAMKTPWKSGQKPNLLRDLPPVTPGESASAASNSVLLPVPYPPLVFFPAGLGIAVNSPKGARWLQLLEDLGETAPSWHSNTLLNKAGCPSFVVSGIAFTASGRIGVAVGGDPEKPDDATDNTAYTDNGRGDWNSCLSDSPPHGYSSAVGYDTASRSWITVRLNGTDISTDNGRDWRPLRPNSLDGDLPNADQRWVALSLPFAVGSGGRIGILRRDVISSTGP